MDRRSKLFSDPVHGFHAVPVELLPLVDAPEVQRLRRIRQLGVGHLVFPGAEHSRFGHALGTLALMADVLASLSETGTPVSRTERLAALAAALLHDVGHGPYSHTLETRLFGGKGHEAMSRALIVRLRDRMPALAGVLGLTLQMFDDAYARPFFHALVSSRLDVDRLDYLRRDAHYTGVVEGQVGVDRLVKTLRVHPVAGEAGCQLVVEAKGAYAVENFLAARRLMYGQVYLHKTVLAGDFVLRAALARAEDLARQADDAGVRAATSDALLFFFDTPAPDFADAAVQDAFLALDDAELLVSLKRWARSSDPLLADRAAAFLDRRLPAVTFLDAPPDAAALARWSAAAEAWLAARGLDPAHVAHVLHVGPDAPPDDAPAPDPILVLNRDGTLSPFDAPDAASRLRTKGRPYVLHPKDLARPTP